MKVTFCYVMNLLTVGKSNSLYPSVKVTTIVEQLSQIINVIIMGIRLHLNTLLLSIVDACFMLCLLKVAVWWNKMFQVLTVFVLIFCCLVTIFIIYMPSQLVQWYFAVMFTSMGFCFLSHFLCDFDHKTPRT